MATESREQRIDKATVEFHGLVLDWIDKHEATRGELVAAFAYSMSRIGSAMKREERNTEAEKS